ncbi:DUF58 domain-containing protein [Microbacterium sp.]|uniref:DUF58 domain-containing protein n=1 Tax=Microbacterium sp. TaxID=51671 RepID=UPI002D792980|nr:DUF58 domain-containing protein [Microbacterium sp.]HET6302060.1 DUF58 domain-containing protein [Microbacterium sp.]
MNRLWPLTARGTGALVLAIACFIIANEVGIPELVYFGMLLVAVLGASIASLYLTRRADTVARSFMPDVASVGRDARVTVRVGVRTAFPTPPGVWQDTLPKGVAGDAHGVFPALGSGLRGSDRIVELTYTVTGTRRGVHPIGPLSVRSTDPFGLARRRNIFGEKTHITIAPAVVDLPALRNFAGEAGGMLHTTTTQLGQGADNLIARPYVPGDSMRRIHWRATAHRDELMVRQEEQESTPEATVVLDRGVLRWAGEAMQAPGADPGFEIAVSAAASVIARLAHDGYAVEVIDSDGTQLAERIDGGDMIEVELVINGFAKLMARRDDHLQQLSRVFSGVMTGPVVVITGRFDTADAAALAPIVHHSTLPVLLTVSPSAGSLERAADLGWRVGRIGEESEITPAWVNAVDRAAANVLQ